MLYQHTEHIFVSYAKKDQERIAAVLNALRKDGYRTWCDMDAVDYADRTSAFAEHIAGCGLFIAFVSKEYFASGQCMRDLDFALIRQKELLFVYLDDISMPFSLTVRLQRPNIVSGFRCSCFDEFYLQLTSHRCLQRFRPEQPLPVDYIFISYAHKDREKVYPILNRLQEEGFSFWVDQRLELAGEFFDDIAAKLDNCGLVIPFFSNAYIESRNCRNELSYAGLLLQKDILPVYLEKVQISSGMRMNFGLIQSILAWETDGLDDICRRLTSAKKMQAFRKAREQE